MREDEGRPEIIQSDSVISPGSVSRVETRGDIIRIMVAAWIPGAALFVGVGFLGLAIWIKDSDLQSWATGLMSLVVGTAIGFAFGSSNRS
jgi:hypothetical protein